MTAFSFWSGHSSGMTVVHILCLPLRQSPDNWFPSPSRWGLYLCHCHYSSSVLLCSPERRDCPDLWTRLAGVPGDRGPGAKGDLRDGAVHHTAQPQSCPKIWFIEFHKMEEKKPERSVDSITQISPICKLAYLHWMGNLSTCFGFCTSSFLRPWSQAP